MKYYKILVIQTAFIGDVILITPLIKALKDKYTNSLIDVMVIPKCAEILYNNPYINKIHVFDKKNMNFIDFYKFILMIKLEKYDISISPHSSLRSALIPFLANIKHRIGFKRYLQKYLLTKSVLHKKNIHKIKKNLALINADNLDYNSMLFPVQENQNKINNILDSLVLKKHIVVVAPGSVWFTKKWPIEKYIELIKKLILHDCFIILIGAKDEVVSCNHIVNSFNDSDPIISVAGDCTILDSAALIQKADLVISNDSGALHIANAVDTTVYAFFGPTTKNIGYFPYRKNDFVFEVDLNCRPCGSHGGKKCPQKHFNCMKLITVDEVLIKIVDMLNL